MSMSQVSSIAAELQLQSSASLPDSIQSATTSPLDDKPRRRRGGRRGKKKPAVALPPNADTNELDPRMNNNDDDESKSLAKLTMVNSADMASTRSLTTTAPTTLTPTRADEFIVLAQQHMEELQELVASQHSHRLQRDVGRDKYLSLVQQALDKFRSHNMWVLDDVTNNDKNSSIPVKTIWCCSRATALLQDLAEAVLECQPKDVLEQLRKVYEAARRDMQDSMPPTTTAAIPHDNMQLVEKGNLPNGSSEGSIDELETLSKSLAGDDLYKDLGSPEVAAAALKKSATEPSIAAVSPASRSAVKNMLSKAQAKLREQLQNKKKILLEQTASVDRARVVMAPIPPIRAILDRDSESMIIRNVDMSDVLTAFLPIATLTSGMGFSHKLLLKRKRALESKLARQEAKRQRLAERQGNTTVSESVLEPDHKDTWKRKSLSRKETVSTSLNQVQNVDQGDDANTNDKAIGVTASSKAARSTRNELVQRRKELERNAIILQFKHMVERDKHEYLVQSKNLQETEHLLSETLPQLEMKKSRAQTLDKEISTLTTRRDVLQRKVSSTSAELRAARNRRYELMNPGAIS